MTGPLRLDRSLIRVAGADARSFLNNLLTQDLDRLAENGAQYSALLTPQGKIMTDMIAWDDQDGAVLLDVDAKRAAEFLKRLTMYKLRAQVTIEDAAERLEVLWSIERFPGSLRDPRLEALGWRAAAPRNGAHHADGDEAFDAHRLALGVPDLARDAAPDEVFAGEALLEELHGVDFQKGCFVGQENVSRMKRRATTRRKFCPIVCEGEALPHGASVRAGEAEIGTVRSGTAGRAIALLRLDRALEAVDTLSVDGRPARLDPPAWLILPGDAPA